MAGFTPCQSSDPTILCKFLKPSQFTCDYQLLGCYGMYVVPEYGCPTSLYVELDELSNGVVIGYTNDAVGGVQAGEAARMIFDIIDNGTNSVRINQVSCY